MRQHLKNILEWLLWFPGQIILNFVWQGRLPYRFAFRLAKWFSFLHKSRFGVLNREYEKSSFFNHLTPQKCRDIVRRSLVLDVADKLEIINYPRFGRHAEGRQLALETIPQVDGLDHLDDALKEGGVILAHLHFGAMQMVLPALGHRGYDIAQIGDSRLAVLDNTIKKKSILLKAVLEKQNRFEQCLPAPFFYSGKDTRKAVKWLKTGNIVDLAMDGRKGQQWINMRFLDRPASFADNPFRLAKLTGSSVLPTFIIRRPDNRLRLVIEEPIARVKELEKLDAETMLKRFINLADDYVKSYPCHFCRRMWVMERQKPFLQHPLFED